jgi:hypothetical protein
VVKHPDFPDYDAKGVIGMTVPDATALLGAHGFTMIPAYDADKEVALTLELMPTRCRLFQRDGIVIQTMTG